MTPVSTLSSQHSAVCLRWIFGNHKFGSMKSVVQLLQTKPIKSKTGKMIRLGAPAPGGISRDEVSLHLSPLERAPLAMVFPFSGLFRHLNSWSLQ
jgi:hypothetical protein